MNQVEATHPDARRRTSARRIGWFVLGAITGFICALIVVIGLVNVVGPDIYAYKGEGSIQFIGTPIITPGYTVELDPFDLGKPAAMTFDVSSLPRNGLQWPLFAVNILSLSPINFDQDEPRSQRVNNVGKFTGTLHLRLVNRAGPVIFDIEAPMDEWIAHEANTGRGGLYKYELYFMPANADDSETTHVDPTLIARDAHLTFEVEYEPGERPIDAIGIPIIRSGGYL